MTQGKRPKIVKHEVWISRFAETCPVIYKGRLLMAAYVEDVPALVPLGEEKAHPNPRVAIADFESRETLTTLAHGFSYPSAHVEDDIFYVFVSSSHADGMNARGPFDIHVFYSSDLKNWNSHLVVPHAAGERNCNNSVCKAPDGYVMAYEIYSFARRSFRIRFARSKDLVHWAKVAGLAWRKEKYTAGPTICYHNGYYYMFYMNQTEGRWHFENHLARSKNLADWEESPLNPVLSPLPEEGINNSDIDVVEYKGKSYMFYSTGDQRGSGKLKLATFDGTLGQLLEGFFS